jgi:hypothetical protein
MARRHGIGILGVVLASALSAPAMAQRGDSGSITGNVFDQTGAPLKGIRVTISSPTQIGGKKVAYTNDEGAFRFPILEPGEFEVKFEAPKMQTIVQKAKVGINAPVELNPVMDVAQTQVEEVKVVEKAPLVSTSTPNVKEVYDIDFVDQMPHDNRDVIYQQISNYAAGAIKGGRIRGGGGNQTIYMMDGFNMLRQYPTVKASAAYEIQTAGYGADNATAPGGVVNLVTRSGSNKWELEMGVTYDDSRFELLKDGNDAAYPSHFLVVNPTLSGPIVKDRLWFSVNAEFLSRVTGRAPDVERMVPDPLPELRNWHKGTGKVTWQITSRNKVSGVMNWDEWWQYNRTGTLGYNKDSQSEGRSRKYFFGLIWETLLTDSLVFRSQGSYITLANHFFPERCVDEPVDCDHYPQLVIKNPRAQYLQNANVHNRDDVYQFEFINRLEYFVASKAIGEHHFQLKDRAQQHREIFRKAVPGDKLYEYTNTTLPEALTTYYSNDPRSDSGERFGWFNTETNALNNSLSFTDAWRPTRYLTITPGLAYSNVKGTNSQGQTVVEGSAFSPSFSLAWDATHDGRTVLRGSYNKYIDIDVNSGAASPAAHTLGNQVQRKCKWNDANQTYDKECEYSGGASGSTIGLPCGPTGFDSQGNRCQQSLTLPSTYEYTVGGEREVVEGLAISTDFIYRRFENQFEKLETNRIWNSSGTELDKLGGYRNGRATQVSDLETPDGAWRRYIGVTTGFTRREGKMKLHADYTWSRLTGTVLEGTSNQYGDIGPRDVYIFGGVLPDDHRHEIKVNMSYRPLRWLGTSVRYSYYSGLPYSRMFRNTQTGGFDDYRARVGDNPGSNLNDPADDRPLRTPDLHSLNAQIQINFLPLIGQNLEAFMDVLNVLNLRTTTDVAVNDGQDFGVERGRQASLRLRFGARYRY